MAWELSYDEKKQRTIKKASAIKEIIELLIIYYDILNEDSQESNDVWRNILDITIVNDITEEEKNSILQMLGLLEINYGTWYK